MPSPRATHTTAILLAAGTATRMGTDKMNLPYKGTTLFQRAVTPIVDCSLIRELIVVVRPDARSLVENVDCTAVVNPHWQEGMGVSLRLGVAAAAEDADVLLVCLADMPEISAGLLGELIDAFGRCKQSILTPYCEGRTGHPVLFDDSWRSRLEQLGGDVGARHLLRQSPDADARFETTDRAVLFDVDSPEDARLRHISVRSTAHASTLAVALRREGIYCTFIEPDGDDAQSHVGATVAIGYHAFDEARVAEIRASLESADA